MRDLGEQIKAVLAIGREEPAVQYGGSWYSWSWLAGVGELIEGVMSGFPPLTSIGIVTRNRPGILASYAASWIRSYPVLTFNALSTDLSLCHSIRALRPAVLVAAPEDWNRPDFKEAVSEVGATAVLVTVEGSGAEIVHRPALWGGPLFHRSDPGVAIHLLTSGTTGPPKRVAIELDHLASAVRGAQLLVNATPDEAPRLRRGTTIISLPLGHLGAVFSICLNVAEGRRIVLMDRFDPYEWAKLVHEHNVAVLNLVPAAMRMILDAKVPADLLSGATIARSGTAVLPVELADEFEATYGVPVLQNYGSTEFAGGVAGWNLAQWRQWGTTKRGSVGTAVPGVVLRVVDPGDGTILPAGTRGVLEVCSPHTAGVAPGTWVRTSDLAEIDADGFVWIHGRTDDVIIRGGFKVDASEVRRTLESNPLVKEAAVVSIPDRRLGQVPVAAVELEPGCSAGPEVLRSWLHERLEAYKVPVEIQIVDRLPRNGTLKVELPAVRALFGEAPLVDQGSSQG